MDNYEWGKVCDSDDEDYGTEEEEDFDDVYHDMEEFGSNVIQQVALMQLVDTIMEKKDILEVKLSKVPAKAAPSLSIELFCQGKRILFKLTLDTGASATIVSSRFMGERAQGVLLQRSAYPGGRLRPSHLGLHVLFHLIHGVGHPRCMLCFSSDPGWHVAILVPHG